MAGSSDRLAATLGWQEWVRAQVASIRFGVIQIVVHDGRVVQVEKTEKVRFDAPETKLDRDVEGLRRPEDRRPNDA